MNGLTGSVTGPWGFNCSDGPASLPAGVVRPGTSGTTERATGEAHSDPTIEAHYRAHVQPAADHFEQKRQAAVESFKLRTLFVVPVFATLSGIAFWACYDPSQYVQKNIYIAAIITIALLIIGGLLLHAPLSSYNTDVKRDVFPLIFRYFGEDFVYRAECPVTISSLDHYGITPHHDRAQTEDYVCGHRGDIKIQLFEAKLTKQQKIGKSRTTIPVFTGLCVTLDMNKPFNGKTVVMRDTGAIGNWANGLFDGLDRVKLEDPVFERAFEVYSDDQVEARYLLTTSFMERLMTLLQAHYGSGFGASFHRGQLLLLLPSGHDYFEAQSVFKPVNFEFETRRVVQQMNQIFGIIETLRLDERTGL